MGSTRFPGKPLALLNGKPMVEWVVDAAKKVQFSDCVVVATPDQEIMDYVQQIGHETCYTRDDHETGTDRMAEVAQKLEADIYVNVQGDEPLICPESIEACIQPFFENPEIQVTSIYSECSPAECEDPSVVTVVTDQKGYALYFSRHALPYPRNAHSGMLKKHVGLYAMRREPLLKYSSWPVGLLEKTESLEQLRFLENGVPIFMAYGKGTEMAVDTPEQAKMVSEFLAGRGYS